MNPVFGFIALEGGLMMCTHDIQDDTVFACFVSISVFLPDKLDSSMLLWTVLGGPFGSVVLWSLLVSIL